MSKAQKITAIVMACVFAVLGIFVIFWYFGTSYGDFYKYTKREFAIPGLDTSFTPQGLTHDEQENLFFVSGYMSDGSGSRIYVIDGRTQATVKFVTLINEDRTVYTGHAGGIATDDENIWIAGEGTVNRISAEQLLQAESGDAVQITDSFESNNGADFLTVDRQNNRLWVGEFQRDGNYDTDESHFIETSDGTTNKALSFCYDIATENPEATCGLESLTPVMALSTPSLVQGMVIAEDRLVLSTSYSLPDSHIYIYTNVLNYATEDTFALDTDTNIPLFVLDGTDLLKDLIAPSMSEEIEYVNGRVFILFESACQKYGAVTREPLRNVYSFAL